RSYVICSNKELQRDKGYCDGPACHWIVCTKCPRNQDVHGDAPEADLTLPTEGCTPRRGGSKFGRQRQFPEARDEREPREHSQAPSQRLTHWNAQRTTERPAVSALLRDTTSFRRSAPAVCSALRLNGEKPPSASDALQRVRPAIRETKP